LPAAGAPPNLEADSMAIVFSLPCGIAFRYAAFIAGYDGHSLTDPAAAADACRYDSFDAEVDAVAGLNDDETAICPDKDHDGFPTCDCVPAPVPCDCVDDPAKDPDAPKYHPGAPQACDGPEYSCAPTPCPSGTYCFLHQCLDPCGSGEFKCALGFTCETPTGVDAGPDGGAVPELCVPAPCGDAGVCPPGDVCLSGKCVDPCAPPTKCPYGEICQDGKCKDPCALIKCPAGQTCQNGTCHDDCACLDKSSAGYPCKGTTPACDSKTGGCVPLGCDTTTCPAGQHCESTPAGPTCVGPCDGVVCPTGSTCDPVKGCATPCELRSTPCPTGTVCHESDGTCVDLGCAKVDCPGGFVCKKGSCVPAPTDGCVLCDTGPTDGGRGDGALDASFEDGGADVLADNSSNQDNGGCGCATPGGGGATAGAFFAALALTGLVAARRRRRASHHD
jgi:MYXO-CTERM domain-containing protein